MEMILVSPERLQEIVTEAVKTALVEFHANLTTPDQNKVLNVKDAAKFLNVTTATMYGLVYEKKIPHAKPGGRLYFLESDLMDWVKAGRKQTIGVLDEHARQLINKRSNRRKEHKERTKQSQ